MNVRLNSSASRSSQVGGLHGVQAAPGIRPARSSGRCQGAADCRGFTLAELLAVMLIVMILMGIGVSSFYGLGRGSRRRGAIANFNAVLSLTRQYAVTRMAPLDMVLTNSSVDVYGYYVRSHGAHVPIRPTQYLPPGMKFTKVVMSGSEVPFPPLGGTLFTFRPDGSLLNSQGQPVLGALTVTVDDETGQTASAVSFEINGLTGLVRIVGDD